MNIDALLKPFVWVYRGVVLVSIFIYRTLKIIFYLFFYVLIGIRELCIIIYYGLKYVLLGVGVFLVPVFWLFKNASKKRKQQQLIKINEKINKVKTQTKEIKKESESLIIKEEKNNKNLRKQQIREEKERKIQELKKQKEEELRIRNEKEKEKLEQKIMAKRAKEKLREEKKQKHPQKEKSSKEELKAAKEALKIKRKEEAEERRLGKQKVKAALEAAPKENPFSKFKENFLNWYNNLYVVRNYHNKQDINRRILMIDFNSEDAIRKEKKVRFKYVAKNEDGKILKDTFDAFSKLDVHSFLLSEGYEVYSIEEIKGAIFQFDEISSIRVKPKELIFFLTQLSTYLKAGIPLVDSVKILARQQKKSNRKKLFQAIIYELTMGENFSEALMKQGNVYPRLLINMLRTAEMTGRLPDTLDNMAEYYTAVEKTRKQLISAMTYPSVILVFAIAIVTFILIYVIPQFVDIYGQAGAEVPAITSFIINTSEFLQKNIGIILGVIFITVMLLVLLYKGVKSFKTMIQWILMHIPIISNVIIYNEVTMFTKTFSSLLLHNVFITDSMEILTKITNNEIYKMLMFDAITDIARGENISNSFKGHWAFPDTAYQMLTTGEKTGQLGQMMEKVADYYQDMQANNVNQIKAMIEPALITFLAIVVGGILLAVIIPMFNLYSNLS